LNRRSEQFKPLEIRPTVFCEQGVFTMINNPV
jgi:hypothetical protein